MEEESIGAQQTENLAKRCTQNSCVNDEDEYKFQCKLCERFVHYKCTGLPLYQIYHFTIKGYKRFMCINCTHVPAYLREAIPNNDRTLQTNEMELQTVIHQKETEVDVLLETNRKLSKNVDELQKEIERKNSRSRRGKEGYTKLQDEAKILKNDIQNYEDKCAKLNNTITEQEIELQEIRENSIVEVNDENAINNLEQAMTQKLQVVEQTLKETLLAEVNKNNRHLEEKLDQLIKDNKSYADTVKNFQTINPTHPSSYGKSEQNEQSVVESVDLRKIMIDQKNDEKVEYAEREKRRKNFIIHGLEEKGETMDDIKKNDDELISQFMTKIGNTENPVSITRLGKTNDKKNRTMKIIVASSEEKDFIMGNLKYLKGSEVFGKIRVTDDYTNGERDLIRHWVKEAEKKSAVDATKVYRVRGDPKNGLRLVSFARQNNPQNLV